MARLKAYLTFLAAHWIHTLILLMIVAVFVAGPLRSLYSQIQSRLTFLPAPRAA